MKIGIITHYYNSKNYGGSLQAFALASYLNSNFGEAQQICYKRTVDEWSAEGNPLWKRFARMVKRWLKCSCQAISRPRVWLGLRKRQTAFASFLASVPHTKTVFTRKNLANCASQFDAFVTGSDQVWNPKSFCPAYLLSFVDGTKKRKISYAASVVETSLTEGEAGLFKEALFDYSAISVRERSAVSLLQPLSPVRVTEVVDPVFLLAETDWNGVSSKRLVDEDYAFAFFLGERTELFLLFDEFCAKFGLKKVTISHTTGQKRFPKSKDLIDFISASPQDFLSLIRHANYVFTDSFHCAAFSLIFRRQFFAFDRFSDSSMNSRLVDLTLAADCPERFFRSGNESFTQVVNAKPIDYCRVATFEENLKCSKEFLKRSLSKND